MFGNLGLHINRAPTGRYHYVGTIPRCLGKEVPATTADVMGQRAYRNDRGELVATKFPTYPTAQEARDHARNCGAALCQSETCSCYGRDRA